MKSFRLQKRRRSLNREFSLPAIHSQAILAFILPQPKAAVVSIREVVGDHRSGGGSAGSSGLKQVETLGLYGLNHIAIPIVEVVGTKAGGGIFWWTVHGERSSVAASISTTPQLHKSTNQQLHQLFQELPLPDARFLTYPIP